MGPGRSTPTDPRTGLIALYFALERCGGGEGGRSRNADFPLREIGGYRRGVDVGQFSGAAREALPRARIGGAGRDRRGARTATSKRHRGRARAARSVPARERGGRRAVPVERSRSSAASRPTRARRSARSPTVTASRSGDGRRTGRDRPIWLGDASLRSGRNSLSGRAAVRRLAAAHRAASTTRVKPSNVWCGPGPQLDGRLCDFGLVRTAVLGADDGERRAGHAPTHGARGGQDGDAVDVATSTAWASRRSRR